MYGFRFEFTGITSLIMNAADIAAADRVSAWRKAPENKKQKKGDDRFPSWTYKTKFHHDGKEVAIPGMMVMSCLMKGGVEFSLQGSRKSLKAATQTCIRLKDEYLHLETHNGKIITVKDLEKIPNDKPYEVHNAAIEKLGLVIDCRMAPIGQSKHIRCRPRFLPGWKAAGEGVVTDDAKIPFDQLQALFTFCGDMVGIGDWRPSAPKSPGFHGRFTAVLEEVG